MLRHWPGRSFTGYLWVMRGMNAQVGAILMLAVLASCAPAEEVSAPPAGDRHLRVATFNVHYLWRGADTAVARWEPRGAAVVTLLSEIDADLVAFQEMETFSGSSYNRENRQMDTLSAAFPDFGFAATGDPREYPNTQPIMFRRSKLTPLEQGFFFFSPQPQELYSAPWFGRFPSFGTWARFRRHAESGDAGNSTILVFNVHIDRERYRNQLRSARLVAEQVNALRRPEEPVLVFGDFNALRFMAPVRIVTREAGLQAAKGIGATFHFYRGLHLFPAIDHILYGERWELKDARAVRMRPGGVWPSDHYPVMADLYFQ